MNPQRQNSDPHLDPIVRLVLTVLLGIVVGATAGLGSVVHQGVGANEALLVGLGFFAGVFALSYVRPFRRFAELLAFLR